MDDNDRIITIEINGVKVTCAVHEETKLGMPRPYGWIYCPPGVIDELCPVEVDNKVSRKKKYVKGQGLWE